MAILLITATIVPPKTAVRLARSDPEDRFRDYFSALRFYLDQLDRGTVHAIVFAENSNADIDALKALSLQCIRPKNVEFISFHGLDYPPENGRAYGEMRLIDHAMSHSALIRGASPDEIIWKVTGRYVVRNIERLVSVRRPADFYCQCRNFPVRWTDMYFMGWTRAGYLQTIAGAGERIKEKADAASSEVEFRKLIDEKAKCLKVERRFPEVPQVSGVRGWDNRKYESQWARRWFRSFLLLIAPWIWI